MTNGPSHLTDAELLAEVRRLAARERSSSAEFIAGIGELDARRLHLEEGFPSLFDYCRRVLHLSEDRACSSIAAARAARTYPVVLEMLADGRLNLSTLRLLIPHLAEDHRALLASAAYKSKVQVQELIARRSPRPDVATAVRRLPATVDPLAPDRYLVRVTVDAETVTLLRRAQDLGRHALPTGDEGEILKRALRAYVADLERRRFSATARPRSATRPRDDASRDIPAAVKRAVWLRDDGQCSFAGSGGRRCEARGFLEFHHLSPYAAGGQASVENIALRCGAHNQYEADRFFAPIRAEMSVHHSSRPGTG